jgi:hypothetical protein
MSEPVASGPDWLFGYKLLFNPLLRGTGWEVKRAKRLNAYSPALNADTVVTVTSDRLESVKIHGGKQVDYPPRQKHPFNGAAGKASALIFTFVA